MFAPTPAATPTAPATTPPYSPVFRNDVVVAGYGYTTPVNPIYCLQEASVPGLIAALKALGLVAFEFQRDPLGYFAGGFSQSATVAWLQFNDGTQINAGLLADCWNPYHGYPVSYSQNLALRRYQEAAYDQGLGPQPPATPVTA